MSKPTNPLLIAIRTAFPKIDCARTYTTAYKAGGFRVKLYCCRRLPVGLRTKLAAVGFTDVTVSNDRRHWGASVTIRAALAA